MSYLEAFKELSGTFADSLRLTPNTTETFECYQRLAQKTNH